MKSQKQKVFDKEKGDCFRACIASILEVENNDTLYKIKSDCGWLIPCIKVLEKMGLALGWHDKAIWRSGYWIASVPSLNFNNTTHAIVMKGHKVEFDPSTHKKYKKGRNLLGEEIVSFGYWIEASDFSKLKKYLLQ